MFLIQLDNFSIAKKSKLSTVQRFFTHFHKNTVVFKNSQENIENSYFKNIDERKNLFFTELIKLN